MYAGFYAAMSTWGQQARENTAAPALSADRQSLTRHGQAAGNWLEKGMKKALITGITGQDGAYLAELLLEKGYEVQ
ncbi:MAG: GDP-mannose 4,6-dehydratase, partial [Desulfovibrionaceae bacterium]|nr:GDP-mannose 4,6-dehydratase [Desulfovibrionaceae bacterium]